MCKTKSKMLNQLSPEDLCLHVMICSDKSDFSAREKSSELSLDREAEALHFALTQSTSLFRHFARAVKVHMSGNFCWS